jgi:hypothetical protein
MFAHACPILRIPDIPFWLRRVKCSINFNDGHKINDMSGYGMRSIDKFFADKNEEDDVGDNILDDEINNDSEYYFDFPEKCRPWEDLDLLDIYNNTDQEDCYWLEMSYYRYQCGR